MKTIDQLLIELEACKKAKKWALGKTFIEVYTTCHRGDWLNWLFSKTNPEDIQLLMLVKGHQANTVRHLMKDDRSLKAVDTAIAFGEGRATKEELINAADAAGHAARAAADAAWAARAAATAAWAARAAATASYAATAYNAAEASYAEAEQANQKLTADIFRKYISIEKFKI